MVLESTNDGDDHCQPKHIIRRAEVAAPAAAAAESLVGFNRAAYVYLRPRCLSDRLVPLLLLTDHDHDTIDNGTGGVRSSQAVSIHFLVSGGVGVVVCGWGSSWGLICVIGSEKWESKHYKSHLIV